MPEHGTLVGEGINAQHHQHMFCARLDPAVDDPQGGKGLVVSEVGRWLDLVHLLQAGATVAQGTEHMVCAVCALALLVNASLWMVSVPTDTLDVALLSPSRWTWSPCPLAPTTPTATASAPWRPA